VVTPHQEPIQLPCSPAPSPAPSICAPAPASASAAFGPFSLVRTACSMANTCMLCEHLAQCLQDGNIQQEGLKVHRGWYTGDNTHKHSSCRPGSAPAIQPSLHQQLPSGTAVHDTLRATVCVASAACIGTSSTCCPLHGSPLSCSSPLWRSLLRLRLPLARLWSLSRLRSRRRSLLLLLVLLRRRPLLLLRLLLRRRLSRLTLLLPRRLLRLWLSFFLSLSLLLLLLLRRRPASLSLLLLLLLRRRAASLLLLLLRRRPLLLLRSLPRCLSFVLSFSLSLSLSLFLTSPSSFLPLSSGALPATACGLGCFRPCCCCCCCCCCFS
jgi:hypothetical protein